MLAAGIDHCDRHPREKRGPGPGGAQHLASQVSEHSPSRRWGRGTLCELRHKDAAARGRKKKSTPGGTESRDPGPPLQECQARPSPAQAPDVRVPGRADVISSLLLFLPFVSSPLFPPSLAQGAEQHRSGCERPGSGVHPGPVHGPR